MIKDVAFEILRERLHEVKRGLFPALKLGNFLHTGLKLTNGPLLAHVDAPFGGNGLVLNPTRIPDEASLTCATKEIQNRR